MPALWWCIVCPCHRVDECGAPWIAECGMSWRHQLLREEMAAEAAANESGAPAAAAAAAAPADVADPVVEVPTPRSSQRKAKPPWHCQRCGTSTTPCHRPGPAGRATLCNGTFAGGGRAEEGRAGRGARLCSARIGGDVCREADSLLGVPAGWACANVRPFAPGCRRSLASWVVRCRFWVGRVSGCRGCSVRASVEGPAKAGGAGGFSGGFHGCGRGARAGCCYCAWRCSTLGTPAAPAAAAAACPMPTVVDSVSSVCLHRAMGSGRRGCCARFAHHGGWWVVLPLLRWAGPAVRCQRHGPPVARLRDAVSRPLRWTALLVGSRRRHALCRGCGSLDWLAVRVAMWTTFFCLWALFFRDVHCGCGGGQPGFVVGRLNLYMWVFVCRGSATGCRPFVVVVFCDSTRPRGESSLPVVSRSGSRLMMKSSSRPSPGRQAAACQCVAAAYCTMTMRGL